MNQQNDTPNNGRAQAPRGRRWLKTGIAVALLGALVAAGASFAANEGACQGRFGMGMHGRMNPENMAKHVDGMVNHVLSDATPEQKAKVSTILKAALTDLGPLRAQHQAAHKQALSLLTQPTIDRAALEKVRADEMQLAELTSKRITQALGDAAEVLTPEQRVKLVEHFKKRMG